MNAKKTSTKSGRKNQKDVKSDPIPPEETSAEEDLWEDKDFGGLEAPEDFKRQLGCGG
ncbi:hypothetical protein QQ020_22150 [Fulvivirgaceae bacterium BMA12]|uniref:Uncharacterized protein n=1 Tax=Agaribacillus aureus TaxID=3051825 RepID=A0ABT8LAL2_9BACT|nr:hypothetical protein [Fulvivirgaceae bacterium BMA12]